MVTLYVDLVELGLRALETNVDNIPLVPAFLKDKVKMELEKRVAIKTA